MKYLNVALIALMISFTGCDDEQSDEGPVPEVNFSPLMTIDFSYYLGEGSSGYVVITDTLNTVIGQVEITNSTIVDILPAESFSGEVINAYFVHDTGEFFHINAYLHIRRGSPYDFRGYTVYGARNPIQLRMTNVPQFDYLTMGTNWYARTYLNSNLSDTASYGTRLNYLEGGSIYAQIVSNDEGKFGFIPIRDDQSTYDVNIGELDGKSLRKDITVPDNVYGSYFIIGYEADGNVESHYWLFEREFNGSSFPIFYPDVPFSKYNTSLYMKTGNESMVYLRSGEVVTEYAPLTFSSSVSGRFPDSFAYTPSGDFDYYNAEFRHSNGKEFVHVFAPRSVSSFSIPDFSSFLSLPPRDFKMFKLSSVSLVNVLEHVEDEPYFQLYSSYPPSTPNVDRLSYTF